MIIIMMNIIRGHTLEAATPCHPPIPSCFVWLPVLLWIRAIKGYWASFIDAWPLFCSCGSGGWVFTGWRLGGMGLCGSWSRFNHQSGHAVQEQPLLLSEHRLPCMLFVESQSSRIPDYMIIIAIITYMVISLSLYQSLSLYLFLSIHIYIYIYIYVF